MYMYNIIANRDLLGQDRKRRMVRVGGKRGCTEAKMDGQCP